MERHTSQPDPRSFSWLFTHLWEGPEPPMAPVLKKTDWPELTQAAVGHGLAALVPQSALGEAPAATQQAFEAACRFTLASNIALLDAAKRVQRALREAGVDSLALKGAALLEQGIYKPGQRPMSDIDLLIRREELERAWAVLVQDGWSSPSDEERARALTHHHHWHFALPNTRPGVALDLHWTPTSGERRLPALESLQVFGDAPRELSLSSQLYFLCVNAARHHYGNGRLLLVYDLARVCARHGEKLDWNHVAALAQETGTLRQVRLALLCAGKFFGAPSALPTQLSVSGITERLLLRRLSSPWRAISRFERRAVRVISADSWGERARLIKFALS